MPRTATWSRASIGPLDPLFRPKKRSGKVDVGITPTPVPDVVGTMAGAWGSWVGHADGVVTP
jgi:hypothetical protein